MTNKPTPKSSLADKEISRLEKQFDDYDKKVSELTHDRMNLAPKEEVEPQTKLSKKEIDKANNLYLKPWKTIGSKEKFNEKFREDYEHSKEYVHFIAENKELMGDLIELWTKPFPGMNAEMWKIPPNTPVWGPRYLANQIKGCSYHRLKSEQSTITNADGNGTYHGALVVDSIVQRLDAYPVHEKKSVFSGTGSF